MKQNKEKERKPAARWASGADPQAVAETVTARAALPWMMEQIDRNVLAVRTKTAPDWRQDFLILSDVHFDSLHSKRHKLKKLLDEAVARGAGVLCTGDFFDAMQAKGDPRGSKGSLSPAYLDDEYWGRLLDDAEDFLRPYAPYILFLGDGNHETSVRKHHELDLLALLCRRLGVIHLGYSGWVQFFFTKAAGGGRTSRTLWFHHGGLGGEVTQGIGWAQRTQSYVHDVDIYVSGHRHNSWRTEMQRLRITQKGKTYQDTALHISVPGMKDEYDSRAGYHVERGRTPRPTGAFWLVFWWDHEKPGCVALDAHRAY